MTDYLNLLNITKEEFEMLFQEFILEHNLANNESVRILFAKGLILERIRQIQKEMIALIDWVEIHGRI